MARKDHKKRVCTMHKRQITVLQVALQQLRKFRVRFIKKVGTYIYYTSFGGTAVNRKENWKRIIKQLVLKCFLFLQSIMKSSCCRSVVLCCEAYSKHLIEIAAPHRRQYFQFVIHSIHLHFQLIFLGPACMLLLILQHIVDHG